MDFKAQLFVPGLPLSLGKARPAAFATEIVNTHDFRNIVGNAPAAQHQAHKLGIPIHIRPAKFFWKKPPASPVEVAPDDARCVDIEGIASLV